MELNAFINLIKAKKQTITSVVFFFLILAIIFTIIHPFKYVSESKLLIVQNFPANIDSYGISKSNEYLSTVFAEIIVSNSFFNKIMDAGFNIEKDYFNGNTKKQIRKWQKTVAVKAINNTGIINVKVYHPDKNQAEQIAWAIGYVIKTEHALYHGSGDSVIIKTIEQPITSNWPVTPNVILNLMLGIISGLIIGLCYIYLFPEEKYNLRIIPLRKKKTDSAYNFLNAKKAKHKWLFGNKSDNHKKSLNIMAEKEITKTEEQNSGGTPSVDDYENNINQEDSREYQSICEDIINKGNIKNVFGQSSQDNY